MINKNISTKNLLRKLSSIIISDKVADIFKNIGIDTITFIRFKIFFIF